MDLHVVVPRVISDYGAEDETASRDDRLHGPYELATFWSRLIDWPISDLDEAGDDEVLVEAPDHVPGLLFVRVPEPRAVKNRVHLDWEPDRRSRDEEVERAVNLGATIHEDHRGPEDRGWVTLHDPEGNEFCIEQR